LAPIHKDGQVIRIPPEELAEMLKVIEPEVTVQS
jgi:hypothetical protein